MPPRHPKSGKLSYRPDIDGLRAVAVLLVLADHLRTRIAGGYIGVDVFFVISGYLISTVILNEIEAGTFSLVKFYERRVRRIIPALIVMLAVTSVFAYRCFMPGSLADYARSVIAALLSFSNILFWKQSGYFDAPSLAKPLLHTWSLAVEEQFYVVFPLLLLALRKWSREQLRNVVFVLTVVSFVLACWWIQRDATTAFFWAPLRAWELLIGTIVSQRYLPAIRSRWARETATAGGLLLILVPALRYTALTHFPGLAALPPCVGAALIIAGGEEGDSLAGKLLSWRPVVFVGLISYSLYLWHWPLIVFQTSDHVLVDRPQMSTHSTQLIMIAVSLVVATLSWALVEQPFREGRFRPRRGAMFAMAGAAMGVLLVMAAGVVKADGIPSRFSSSEMATIRAGGYLPEPEYRRDVCLVDNMSRFKPDICFAETPGKKHYLMMGDSTSAQFYWGLSHVFPNIDWMQANVITCPPVIDADYLKARGTSQACQDMSRYMYGNYLLHHHPDAVLLAGIWLPADMPALDRSIKWLLQHGFRVILFTRTMEYRAPLPQLLFRASHYHDPGIVQRNYIEDRRTFSQQMAAMAKNTWKVEAISEIDDLCTRQSDLEAQMKLDTVDGCPLFAAPNVPMMWDSYHLTLAGSMLMAQAIRDRRQLP